MKKLFALVAVVMFAFSVNAAVVFDETFSTRRGSTYIAKVHLDSYDAWPYANQWFTGYNEGKDDEVVGNQFDNDYTAVSSYNCSVRGKQLDGSDKNTVGLFFGANKAADQCYVKFEGALPTVTDNAVLKFVVCSSETDGGDLSTMIVKVNDNELTVPETTLGNKGITSTVEIPLTAGEIESLEFAFDNVPAQKFISHFWIEDSTEGIENVFTSEKAQKVMIDGVMYIVRDGKMFNAIGAQVR